MSCSMAGGSCSRNGGLTMNSNGKRPYDGSSYARQYYPGGNDDTPNGVSSALYFPYSTENLQPKWPDGLSQFTEGVKKFYNKEIVFPADHMLFVLLPGLSNFLNIFKYNEGTAQYEVFSTGNFNNHLNLTLLNEKYIVQSEKFYSAWRPVSYAVHLWCTNNENQNDGWFDCVRLSNPRQDTTFGTATTADEENDISVGDVIYHPINLKTKFGYQTNGDLFNRTITKQPSYYIGTISELNGYVFQLNPEKRDNEFLDMRPVVINSAGAEIIQPGGVHFHSDQALSENPSAKGRDVLNNRDTLLADSHDIVILRLFGKKEETRMLIQGVANTELIPNENSSKYNSATENVPALEAVNRYIENRSKWHKLPFHIMR